MSQVDSNIIVSLNNLLGVELKQSLSLDELLEQIAGHLNSLITTDFNKLISLLYRLDIDELRVRATLQNHPGTDAGKLLAALVMERQLRKLESRKHFSPNKNEDIDDNEKW